MEAIEVSPGIIVDPKVSFGKPVIKGTRISVDVVLHQLAAGVGYDEMEREYGLSKPQLLDALRYAADLVSGELVHAD